MLDEHQPNVEFDEQSQRSHLVLYVGGVALAAPLPHPLLVQPPRVPIPVHVEMEQRHVPPVVGVQERAQRPIVPVMRIREQSARALRQPARVVVGVRQAVVRPCVILLQHHTPLCGLVCGICLPVLLEAEAEHGVVVGARLMAARHLVKLADGEHLGHTACGEIEQLRPLESEQVLWVVSEHFLVRLCGLVGVALADPRIHRLHIQLRPRINVRHSLAVPGHGCNERCRRRYVIRADGAVGLCDAGEPAAGIFRVSLLARMPLCAVGEDAVDVIAIGTCCCFVRRVQRIAELVLQHDITRRLSWLVG
mmetsp:Transcript_41855/g.118703  ORF Transcript_41855/g.118703 Transcript_41855/m.118703 type:complete len:307 (-) Transcript_41855:10-930(-)